VPHSQRQNTSPKQLRNSLIALPRSTKRLLMLVADLLMLPACLWGAISLKYDSLTLGFQQSPLLYVGAAATSIVVFMKLGLYRAIMRFIGFRMLVAVFAGAIASGAIMWLIGGYMGSVETRPVSLVIIYVLNVLAWVSATRLLVRWIRCG
jgi:FlaA1/EpsC-like NDP-sugar epimerase